MKANRSLRAVFLLALAMLTFLPLLGNRDIITSHEARVVQVARQMAEVGWPWNARKIDVPAVELARTPLGQRLQPKLDGSVLSVNPWIVPVMNGQIRLQKPPLPYWCTAVLYRLFGFSELTSRLIPALLGAVSVLLVWDLARTLIGRTGAWYAALVWTSSYFIVDEFRKSMADPYLAFFTLGAMWAWMRGRSVKYGVLFYAMLGMGVLAKGPLIFVFVGAMIAAQFMLRRNRTRPFGPPLNGHLVGIIAFLLITLPWGIAVVRSVPNAVELWRYESIGALADKNEDSRPFWFYLPNLLLITLPWTPVWVMGVVMAIKHPNRRRLVAVVTSAIVILIFSLANGKKNAYLLPLMPLQAILVAQGIIWLTILRRKDPVRVVMKRMVALAVLFSVAIQIFVGVIHARMDNRRSPRDACRYVARLLGESSNRSLLTSRLGDEAFVYLPLGIREAANSSEVFFIADDRKGEAETLARLITTTPSGTATNVESMPVPDSPVTRWKVYKLTVSPVERATPGAG